MIGGITRVQWYAERVLRYTTIAPQQAHSHAAALAAGEGAKAIDSKASGRLAREISRPRPDGAMRSLVGSNLPYAGVEGKPRGEVTIIQPRRSKRLLIHGTRVSSRGRATRSTFGGAVVASAPQVAHEGKGWIDRVRETYVPAFLVELRRRLSGGLGL
jgi:hypothetical protein